MGRPPQACWTAPSGSGRDRRGRDRWGRGGDLVGRRAPTRPHGRHPAGRRRGLRPPTRSRQRRLTRMSRRRRSSAPTGCRTDQTIEWPSLTHCFPLIVLSKGAAEKTAAFSHQRFGDPADSESSVALRPPLARGLPFSTVACCANDINRTFQSDSMAREHDASNATIQRPSCHRGHSESCPRPSPPPHRAFLQGSTWARRLVRTSCMSLERPVQERFVSWRSLAQARNATRQHFHSTGRDANDTRTRTFLNPCMRTPVGLKSNPQTRPFVPQPRHAASVPTSGNR